MMMEGVGKPSAPPHTHAPAHAPEPPPHMHPHMHLSPPPHMHLSPPTLIIPLTPTLPHLLASLQVPLPQVVAIVADINDVRVVQLAQGGQLPHCRVAGGGGEG